MAGYPKVAHLMATQEEFAILRRFRVLNMQKLLYLQAEISHLEAELNQLATRDETHADRQYHAKDWWSLSHGEGENDSEQWLKFLELSKKLDFYNDAVLKHAALARLEQPRKYDLDFLRSWFRRPGMGSFPLLGIDRESWDPKNEDDLIAIRPRAAPDIFSKWLTEGIVPFYHRIIGKRFKEQLPDTIGTGIYHYKESSLELRLGIMATVVASVLPICSVVVLYFIKSNNLRLGLLAVFSAIFSLALALMTNARRIEVFAATAAFAAVNVVFLSNDSACSPAPIAIGAGLNDAAP
ncbi:hypothetical protein GLAREA_02261 [Glarea lozoyensis ATCC 20868]|uniref:DUF6594 domain-containing protein n=1 Tax=Glarea lozoyensis (strain ATCC 20868 / MF5171) TaxID=1116229 RepID=S3CMC0_GLAL2|nr:uncharacterized protein GLAREA_02261 [Glarea lozoyensis ATCC 20868]EPE26349.1 hypothetical protein GLAREA_02261 [Glarea lozoyensis ATCC 20868]